MLTIGKSHSIDFHRGALDGSEKNRLIDLSLLKATKCRRVSVAVVYLELVYFVTALVPSDTACLASSPGKRRRTAV